MNLISEYWWLVFVAILTGLYYLCTYSYNYFKIRGVHFVKPVPLFGNVFKTNFRLENFTVTFQKFYNECGKHRFIGIFELLTPVYFLRDPELIKQIGIKDFDHFTNHRLTFDEDLEPIFSRNLFSMKDSKWRHMRTTLSPAFTGSKMRQMFELIGECSKETIEMLRKDCTNTSVEMEMKDFFRRFANDVIATTAFGIKTNSIANRDNEFFRKGEILTNFSGFKILKFLGFRAIPSVMKFFRITLLEPETNAFFRELVTSTISYREKNKVFRPDMINLLMQAKNEGSITVEKETAFDDAGFSTVEESKITNINSSAMKWKDDDLTAQCMIFFFAGFDTISQLLSFMSHELAVHPEIQERLRSEVDEIRATLGNQPLTYEVLQKMKYLDMVVSETLRMWPSINAIERQCTKPYVMTDFNGTKVQLNVGDGVWIPIQALHYDPMNFPNPSKFDPERFSDENKHTINPATYLPFGIGPRNCIGSRFALMEAKAIYFHILSSFIIEKSPKTQHPLKLKNESFNSVAENGIWVSLRARV